MFDIEKLTEREFKNILAQFIRVGTDRFCLTTVKVNEEYPPASEPRTTYGDTNNGSRDGKAKCRITRTYGFIRKTSKKRRREVIINPPPPKTVLAFQVNKHLFSVKQPTIEDKQVAKTNNELTKNKIRTIPKKT